MIHHLSILQKQLNKHWIWFLVFTQSILFLYYWMEWGTFANFIQAIDHNTQFIQDFVAHYYPMSKQILEAPTPISGYFYTSFFAVLLIPISTQSLSMAMAIWVIIQFLCLFTLWIFSARKLLNLSWLNSVLYFCLLTSSFPILHNFKWGQVSLLITACIILAFVAQKEDKKILAGMLLALATSIKLYPAYFILYFILKRDIRTVASFTFFTLIFYFFLPASMIGFEDWLNFEKATLEEINGTGWITRDVNSQYITHVGARWFEILFDHPAHKGILEILTRSGYLMAGSCIGMVWLFQKSDAIEERIFSLITLFLVIPFILKTSWPHYFVYLPFCQLALLYYFLSNPNQFVKWLSVFPILSMGLSNIIVFNFFTDWYVYNQYGILFIANLLLLFAMYAMTIHHFFVKKTISASSI